LTSTKEAERSGVVTDAILRLTALNFEGAGLYRQPTQKIPLAKQGRVLLSGEEGAGKSMLPEVMTLILYGKGSPRLRKSGLVESSIVNVDTGYRGELSFESGSGASLRRVGITQAFKHPRLKSRYIINVDGQREEPTTKPEQKKLVKRLAPLSYEEWLGVVYLHQGGVHDLLAGTPTEKREYLTSVFGLDFYDDLLTAAKEEAKALERKGIGALDLQQTLADLKERLKEAEDELQDLPPLAEVDEALEKLSNRLLETSSALGSLRSSKLDAERVEAMRGELAGLGLDDPASELAEAQKAKESLVEKRTKLKTKLADAKRVATAYEAARTRYVNAKNRMEQAQAKVEKLKKEVAALPPRDKCEAAVALCDEAIGLNIDGFNPGGLEAKGKWRDAARTAMTLRDQCRRLEKLATQMRSHKHDSKAECPTCAQPLSLDELDDTVKSLKADAAEFSQMAVDIFSQEVVGLVGEVEGEDSSDIKIALETMVDKHDSLGDAEDAVPITVSGCKEAEEALAETPKPEDTSKLTADIQTTEREISVLDGRIQKANTAIRLEDQIEAIGDVDLAALNEQIEKLEAKQAKSKTKQTEAQDLKRQVTQATTVIATLTKQQKQVQKQIDDHAETALLLQSYERELLPYFTALRASKVKSCVSVLESVLPVYIGTMSARQYEGAEVKLVVSDDLKDVDLTLRVGSNMPWISAVQASGGQRRRFTLAILAALREVSPRKANIMFFDEPFADLEGDGKLLFVNRLIPTLMDRCPDLESLFLIAHDAEVLQAGNDAFDSVWTVDRDEHGSRLLMDQKLSMVAGR
jgi:DNA repair exonuclease SbcCD ATPase subunit